MPNDRVTLCIELEQRVSSEDIISAISERVDKTYSSAREAEPTIEINEIVVQLGPSINWAKHADVLDESLDAIIEKVSYRFPNPDLYLLYSSNFEIILHDLRTGLTSQKGDERLSTLLGEIQSAELFSFGLSDLALYHNYGSYLFKLPNGEIYDYFLRVGNIQLNPASLVSIWFWSITKLKNVDLIVCDTWSISTLSAYIAQHLRDYSERATAIEWRYLSGYLGKDDQVTDETETLFREVKKKGIHAVFLLSASASGRLHNDILRIADKEGIGKCQFEVITLFSLSEETAKHDPLCDLTQELRSQGLEGQVAEDQVLPDKAIFDIDPVTYFPRYFNTISHKFIVGRTNEGSHTFHSRKFFEKYSGFGIFSVCRDGRSNHVINSRHHAFHIDAEKLVMSPPFFSELEASLSGIEVEAGRKITDIVFLDRPADVALKSQIEKILDGAVECFELGCFSEIADTDRVADILLDESRHLLLIDALMISGSSRIKRFQIALRNFLGKPEIQASQIKAKATYLIGCARPSRKNKWETLKSIFPQSGPSTKGWLAIHSVEEILLPDWHADKCPWCLEKKTNEILLTKYQEQMDSRERRHIEKRNEIVSNPNGIQEKLFFRRYDDDEFEFEIGSYFLDKARLASGENSISQSDLACAISSAIQYWRDSTSKMAPANYVINTEIAFDPNIYNETMLVAALWRSLRMNEINLQSVEHDEAIRTLAEYTYFGADRDAAGDRKSEFVLGYEMAFFLRKKLCRVLGQDKFEQIDWGFLRNVAQEH